METVSSEYFHGTNGDNILNIIEKGQLFQIIFLGRYSWESRLMHGRRGLWGSRLYKRQRKVVFCPTTKRLGSIRHDESRPKDSHFLDGHLCFV